MLGVWLSQAALAEAPQSLGCDLEAGPERAVAGVLDGATLRLDDGKDVRLLGVLAPRASDAGAAEGSWPPEEAARTALRDLVQGATVSLAFFGRREDRHGRVLAHVFVDRGSGAIWVQGRMLEQGMARVFITPDNNGCASALLRRERIARERGSNLWSHAAYQIRPGDRPSELQRYRGALQLVRGRVLKVGGGQALATIDLVNAEAPAETDENKDGTGRNKGTRIVWRRSVKLDVPMRRHELVDRDVLVRGWVEVRNGAPEIELVTAGQIELLESPAEVPE